jgi:hypothetical protein
LIFDLWEEEVLVMKKCRNEMRGFLSLCAVAALAVTFSGCVSNKTSSTVSVGLENQYFGAASQVGTPPNWSGGTWSLTLDSSTSYFGYNDVSSGLGSVAGNAPYNGAFTTTSSGFFDLTLTQAATAQTISLGGTGVGGYAVALPGEGLLMRTGSSATDVFGHSPSALIAATRSAACPAFTAAETFNFVAQGTTNQGDSVVHVAYGSVEITPGTQGGANSWSFSNFTMFDLSGNALSPAAIANASCPSTAEGFVLVSPVSNTTNYPAQITTGISPSGLLVINQGLAEDEFGHSLFDSTPTGPVGLMGVIKPSAALNVSELVGKKYAGFESDPLGPLGTVAVVFGTTAGSGTAITGGGYPKDDVTQAPVIDKTLDLGAQSTQTPGLFTSVTLTQPDTYSVCAGTASGGKDSAGNSTCVFHGVAVAGQVGGKYVIFTNINDPTALTSKGATPLAVINLALYQQ